MRQVHSADPVSEPHVDLLEGEEGEVLGSEVRVGELGQQVPGEGAHDADGGVHGSDVRQRHGAVGRQVALQPRLAAGLLDCRRYHHVTVTNMHC